MHAYLSMSACITADFQVPTTGNVVELHTSVDLSSPIVNELDYNLVQ